MCVVVDPNRCRGNAQCVFLTPEVLELHGGGTILHDLGLDDAECLAECLQVLRAAVRLLERAASLVQDRPLRSSAAAAVAREASGRGAVGEMAMAASFLGVLEISLGNYGAALGCLDAAYRDDTPLVGTQVLPDLVEAAVRAGRHDLAERALERLTDRATATGTALALGLLARSRALLAAPAEARQCYEEALRLLGRARTAPQLARTHLLFGEWLRRQRLRREAREQLRTALEMFDALGLRCFAERAGVELAATGEHVRKREVGTPEELTPQEAQIAGLVSRGHANREIAAQLFVSSSTVEYHLRKVFRKLGVNSRTQLAHRVINQGIGDTRPSPNRESPAQVGNRGARNTAHTGPLRRVRPTG